MHGEERKKEREKKVCEYNDTFDVRWRMQATCVYHFPTYNVSLSPGEYSNCHKQFVSRITQSDNHPLQLELMEWIVTDRQN